MQFMDFEFETGNVTLAPRPETELLVEKVLEFVPADFTGKILDIGTGSGNIAISLTKYFPFCRIVALDISGSALRVAAKNAERHGVSDRVKFVKSDLFSNIGASEGLYDIMISNPPYVSLEDLSSLPGGVKDEPYSALYGGRDGLDFYRRITRQSPRFLKRGGTLFLEIGYNQAQEVKNIIENEKSFGSIEIFKDYSGIDRIVKAILTGSLSLIA